MRTVPFEILCEPYQSNRLRRHWSLYESSRSPRSAYVPDHLSLITDRRKMRALFIARPFLVICTKPIFFLVLFRLRVCVTASSNFQCPKSYLPIFCCPVQSRLTLHGECPRYNPRGMNARNTFRIPNVLTYMWPHSELLNPRYWVNGTKQSSSQQQAESC